MADILLSDDHPVPFFLGKAESIGVTKTVAVESGNPNRDVHSGKFGSGGEKPAKERVAPASPDELALARRLDAVREAAREMDGIDINSIQEFMANRGDREFTPEEINDFFRDVISQRMTDVVDSLDKSFRNLEVGMVAPDGWIKDRIVGMNDTQFQHLMQRLAAKGWDDDDIKTHVTRYREAEDGD